MLGRLIFKLLPYALVVGCLALLAYCSSVIANGAESAPTTTSIVGLSKTNPKADWLHVADGGLYLPGTVADTKKGRRSSTVTKTAYYVPLVSREDAMARVAGVASTGSPVYVKFSRSEFEGRFPGLDENSDAEPFSPFDVRGTRAGSYSLSSKFKEYLQSDLRLDPKDVTVIDFDNEPLQVGGAIVLASAAVVVTVGSIFWIKRRWRRPIAA